MVMARRIWLRHNDVVHGGSFTPPNQVFMTVVSELEDFQRINAQPEGMERLEQ